jgi:hypothetical protein
MKKIFGKKLKDTSEVQDINKYNLLS